ncbi:hypothetical protein [Neobacillus vireti]|uniref:Tyr recombinase domain-containing protein n=1 Tax=Neobacillus vireti LMG 21834 TaxID=1131730 RepID=A0AB94IUB1_9BACI|nr:hypothetical protein [Neobacillus vireti]ETI70558.1 hypothetical protein BAVI_01789 [Neobacillus vireti LMG 21834]KLT18409.1 hypothetical protein AA980_08820 [Neobacillus vireti]
MEGYALFSELEEYNLKRYGLNETKMKTLIDGGEIEAKVIGNRYNRTYISIKSVENYIQKVITIRNNYFTLEEAFIKISGKPIRIDSSGLHNFIEQAGLELLELDIPITRKERTFVKRSSCDRFLEEYFSLIEAYKELGLDIELKAFRDNLLKQKIKILELQNLYECKFVKKEDVYRKYRDIITIQECREILSITNENLREAFKAYGIEPFFSNGTNLNISKDDFHLLKDLQEKSLNELMKTTYTLSEVEVFHNEIGTSKPDDDALKRYEIQGAITPLLRVEKYKYKKVLYDKKGIDEFIERMRIERKISDLYNTIMDYPLLLQQVLEVENVQFCENLKITKELWFQYANQTLRKMTGNRDSCLNKITSLKNATKVITNFAKTKELLTFSEKEMNLGIFNKKIPKKHQGHIYAFLYEVVSSIEHNTGKKVLNLSKLNFERQSIKQVKSKSKETYDLEEYMSLYNYVKDYKLHKESAINGIKGIQGQKDLKNGKLYKKYDSMWLYVLLHINNGWRKGTVVDFPRYPSHHFNKFNLTSIESLECLLLTMEDAEQIVRFYQAQWFEHNKTHEKATFYCSSELKLPMAYAILICEYRVRNFHIHDESNLINFYNKKNEVFAGTHDHFFKNYKDEFQFESRKMNRTVLTITSSIIASALNGDPILIAKHLRGHTQTETTNIYIQVPQEHLDSITEQLFDTGYFGYVYQKVNALLLGESSTNKIDTTRHSIELKELLGDVVKLEDMASYLNVLSKRQEELGTYLEELSKEELKSRLNLINLGLSPAKEETYQCFFSTCIAQKTECNKCPFSIPHFYSLSTICRRMRRILSNYKEIAYRDDVPIGEKTKLYNLLLMDFSTIAEAKQKFGREIIEMFMDLDFNGFIKGLEELPDPQEELLLI